MQPTPALLIHRYFISKKIKKIENCLLMQSQEEAQARMESEHAARVQAMISGHKAQVAELEQQIAELADLVEDQQTQLDKHGETWLQLTSDGCVI